METHDWNLLKDINTTNWIAHKCKPHIKSIFCMQSAKYMNKELLATGSFDSELKVWDCEDDNKFVLIAKADHKGKEVRSLVVLENLGVMATGDSGGMLRLFSWPNCKLMSPEIKAHNQRVICLFYFGYHDSSLSTFFLLLMKHINKKYNMRFPKPLQKYICELMVVHHLVTGSVDGTTKVWKIDENQGPSLQFEIKGHEANINDGIQIDNDSFVTCSVDSRLVVYSFKDRCVAREIQYSNYATILCVRKLRLVGLKGVEEDFLIFGCYSGMVVLYSLERKKILFEKKLPDPVGCMSLSKAHPNLIYVGCDDSSVYILEVVIEQNKFHINELDNLKGHSDWLTGVTSTSTHLYSASSDTSLVKWKPDSKDSVYWMLDNSMKRLLK